MEDKPNHTFYAINCDHVYIDDYIDTIFPYREGVPITYCEFCGLSKDYIQKLINENNEKKEKLNQSICLKD